MIELRDAVNEVMKITCEDLKQIGVNLGLGDVSLQDILSYYDMNEQRQRVMELWFKTDAQPTWEKLHAAMPHAEQSRGPSVSSIAMRRESSTTESMTSASPLPMSPDQTSKSFAIQRTIHNSSPRL